MQSGQQDGARQPDQEERRASLQVFHQIEGRRRRLYRRVLWLVAWQCRHDRLQTWRSGRRRIELQGV